MNKERLKLFLEYFNFAADFYMALTKTHRLYLTIIFKNEKSVIDDNKILRTKCFNRITKGDWPGKSLDYESSIQLKHLYPYFFDKNIKFNKN